MSDFSAIDAKYKLPAGTTARIMQVESGGDPNAVSPAGAKGAFQVMPATMKDPGYGVPPFNGNDPDGAAHYFSAMRDKFGSLPLAAAAYNWGPGNLEKYGIDKAPPETQAYVQKVTANLTQPDDFSAMLQQRAAAKDAPQGDQDFMQMLSDRASGKTPKSIVSNSTPVNPTAGMSGFDKFMAGVGKSAVGAGEGIEQLGAEAGNKLGLVSDQTVKNIQNRIDEHAKLDKPLMATGAGAAGNIAGDVGSFFLPGRVVGTAGKALSYVPKGLKAARGLMEAADALNAANKLKTATAIGAASGAIQPVETGQSRLANINLGAAGGALGYGGAKALGYGANVAKGLIAPFTQSGRSNIVGNALREFAGSNDLHSLLNDPKRYVEGSAPTTAQVLADEAHNYSLLPVERAVQNSSPDIADQFAQRQVGNNAARLNSLRTVAGNPETMAAAQAARKQATTPLLDAISKSEELADPSRTVNLIDRIVSKNPGRTQLVSTLKGIRDTLFEPYPLEERAGDAWSHINGILKTNKRMSGADSDALSEARKTLYRAKTGASTADEALEELKGLSAKSKTAKEALDLAQKYLKTPDFVVRQNPSELYSARKNISDMLRQKGPTGAPINEAIARELTVIQKSLDRQIAKGEPAYQKYLKSYADLSRPIDRMKVGQTLINRATSGADRVGGEPALYPEAYGRAIKSDKDLVKKATGFARNKGLAGTMTPQQMSVLRGVQRDLNRQAMGNSMAKAVGSNTVQNLATQNLLSSAFGKRLASSPLGGLLLSRPLSWAIKPMEGRLTEQLGDALLNPAVAAKITAPRAINPLYQRALAAGRMGLIGTSALGLPQTAGLLGH